MQTSGLTIDNEIISGRVDRLSSLSDSSYRRAMELLQHNLTQQSLIALSTVQGNSDVMVYSAAGRIYGILLCRQGGHGNRGRADFVTTERINRLPGRQVVRVIVSLLKTMVKDGRGNSNGVITIPDDLVDNGYPITTMAKRRLSYDDGSLPFDKRGFYHYGINQ